MKGAPPRVLIVIGSIPLYGLELSLIDVGAMLRDRGAEVRFVINRHWGHVAIGPRLESLALPFDSLVFFGSVERGIRLRRLLILARLMVSENLRMLGVLARFRPTHVHLGAHWDFLNLLPALWAWRKPLVFQAGDRPDVRHAGVRWLWRTLVDRAAVLVAVSRDVARQFEALGLRAARTAVIGHRVPARPAAPAVVPTRDARVQFVVVGQVSAHKGCDLVVEAIRALREEGFDVACWLLGATDSAWAGELRGRNADLESARVLRFAGYVADPGPWFAAADVHVMPSRVPETFGISVVEAKAAGCPSIVAAIGALPELVRDGVDGALVAPDDAADLLGAMRRYAADPSRADAQGDAARASLALLGLDRVPVAWAELYGLPT
jgi:glycosyltransferase involved in cell wall biosynthesis